MKLRCWIAESGDGTCDDPVTGGIVLLHPGDGYNILWHCEGHAPEIMHELRADGTTFDEMVTVKVDTPFVETPQNSPRAWLTEHEQTDGIGKRVAMASHTDQWIRGDRYGTCIGRHGPKYTIQLDTSRRVIVCTEQDFGWMEWT